MRTLGLSIVIVQLGLGAFAARALAQMSEPSPVTDPKNWEFSLSMLTYFVPDDREYVQPTVTADYDWLHLEARYNYEDINSGSVWAGVNFSFGDKITLEVTPMIGAVFGDTRGVAPGYEATLAWRNLELYTEGEFLIDANDTSDSFFYTWTEASFYPVEWFRVGVAIERTKAYETDFELQHGLLVGFQNENLNFTTYVFNPEDAPVIVVGIGIDF
jgi:hypothetical protein